MSDTHKQIDSIDQLTREQTDQWIEGVLKEYDWISRDKQKISDALVQVQEKLRPYQDEYANLCENHLKDSERAVELFGKIQILEAKLKEFYGMYKK